MVYWWPFQQYNIPMTIYLFVLYIMWHIELVMVHDNNVNIYMRCSFGSLLIVCLNRNHIALLNITIMLILKMLEGCLMALCRDVRCFVPIYNTIIWYKYTFKYANACSKPYAYFIINLSSIYALQYIWSFMIELNVCGMYYMIRLRYVFYMI